MISPVLQVTDLDVAYGPIMALRQVSFTVKSGEILALVGANGAGKTTLLKCIMGLLRPASGAIFFSGQTLAGVPAYRRSRMGIGYSPEGRRVFPGLTVRENLEVASHGGGQERIAAVYAAFPALEAKQHALGWTLSGGQQQMLAIGRAMMIRPKLLLLDEPSLGLSPKLMDEVLSRIPSIVAEGTTAILAEQNLARALEIADRALVLRTGVVVQEGSAAALRLDPDIRNAYLGGL